jgi:crotonobetainyl-CoA:carnitine CoA-transferase CaiB-like acyl-CoA transferase
MSDTLEGIRIVDLTHYLAGPYATMLMADMGAEVIKVESPEGDPIRKMGPPFEPDGFSPYFRAINRNKRSVVLDLRNPEEKALLLELVKTADAVIDNFRYGVMQRLGLTHQELVKVKPDLITCSITAFGEDGPYRDLPAFDLILQAMSGGMSITGEPGGRPTRAGVPIGDLGGGIFTAFAICAAIIRRHRTGLGQHIDIALLDVQVSLLTYVAQYYATDGKVPQATGASHSSTVPYQAFQTADGYLVTGLLAEHFWPKFCSALERPDLVERYPTNPDRVAARSTLVPLLEGIFRQRPTEEWIQRLVGAGVPVGPLNTIDKVMSDPQVKHRGMVASDGEHLVLGNPVKTGDPDTYSPAPRLGQHSDEILGPLRAAAVPRRD